MTNHHNNNLSSSEFPIKLSGLYKEWNTIQMKEAKSKRCTQENANSHKYPIQFSPKLFTKRYVFNLNLKQSIDGASLISRGNLFHSVGAEKANDLSPYDFSLWKGGLLKRCWFYSWLDNLPWYTVSQVQTGSALPRCSCTYKLAAIL